MTKTISHKKMREIIITIFYYLFIYFNSLGIVDGKTLLSLTIVLNIYFLIKFKESQPIFICLCFMLTYWLYMIMYYFLEINYCTYSLYHTLVFTNGALRIAGLFMAVLFFLLKPIKKSLSDFLPRYNSPLIYYLCIIVMSAIVVYVFNVGGLFTYKEEGNNSSLYEYYFIFAILAFVYTNTKWKKNLYILINIIYVFALLRLGLRLVVMQIAMMLFVLYFSNKLKTKTIFFVVIIAFLFMSLLSSIRNGFQLKSLDITTIIGIRENTLVTNQGDVFYTTAAQYAQIYEGTWDWDFRFSSLLSFFANIVLLPNKQFINGKLNSVLALQSIFVPGGGFGAMSAYVWLGVGGVVALAIYIAYFINSIEIKKSDFNKIYSVFLIFTFYRWSAYNLAIIFKMGFWLLLTYCIIKTFRRITIGGKE